ncbi:MAG: L-threonylcarbamoyladenylate synthase [Patescibacteria group bacterium]
MRVFKKENISEIAAEFFGGNVVIFPTETSYGLGCDATNQTAVDKIYQIKNRPASKSLLIVAPNIAEAKKYLVWNRTIDKLANKFWSGSAHATPDKIKKIAPLTIVGKCASKDLARGVVSKENTVAVRVTYDLWLKELGEQTGLPIIATSANLSGAGDIYNVEEAINQFKDTQFEPDAIVDAGVLPHNLPSTIVDASENKIKILRQGALKISDSFGQAFISIILIGTAVILGALAIVYAWQTALVGMNINLLFTSAYDGEKYPAGEKHYLKTVKGLYLTAYSAGSEKKIDAIINLIDKTELNAVVIDIKDYSGLVLYDSQLATVNELNTEDNRLGDVPALIEKLHEHKIYVIARQTIFQDPVLAEAKSDWAIKKKSGGVWRDKKGLAWVDPTRKEVWEYNLAIAKEAIKFGFDEINFDYVRFPSDGNMSDVVYTVGDKKKYEVMNEFYRYMSAHLRDEPAWLSLDMFGLVMETAPENDMNIGQRLADAVDYADFICPMMYPSHYPSGHLGLKNPADYPTLVFENGLQKGLPKFVDKRAILRPWLQAFNLGAVYGADKIRAQIDATEKYTDAGWLLWNASNNYTDKGLKYER